MSWITAVMAGALDGANAAMGQWGDQSKQTNTVSTTDQKAQEAAKAILTARNEEVYKSLGINGTKGSELAMGRCHIDIDVSVEINVSVEDSGNGSGNVNSSDNGTSGDAATADA